MMELEVIVLIILGSIVALLFLLLTIIFIAVFYYLKKLVVPEKRTFEALVEYEVEEKGFKREWLNIPFKEFILVSKFGYSLYGKLYQAEGKDKGANRVMLALHGHNSCSVSQMKYLEMFLELGFSVFIPDHRYSGYSEGESVTFGVYEKEDVKAWMDLLDIECPKSTYYVFGESMGAATAMMLAAEDDRILKVIEYCGFANIPTLMRAHVGNRFISDKILWPILRAECKLLYKFDLALSNALEGVKTFDKPLLVMHSKADNVVNYENATMIMEVAKNANLVTFEDSMHARSMVLYPEEFRKAVTEFLRH